MKNELTFTGEILEIFPIQTINSADGTKSWKKQEVHVKEFDEQYPQSAVFEVFGADKIDPIFGQFAVGDRGTFHLNIKGNAYRLVVKFKLKNNGLLSNSLGRMLNMIK